MTAKEGRLLFARGLRLFRLLSVLAEVIGAAVAGGLVLLEFAVCTHFGRAGQEIVDFFLGHRFERTGHRQILPQILA